MRSDLRIEADGSACFTLRLRAGWMVSYDLAIEEGRIVVRGLRVFAAGKPPRGGLTAGYLREELVLGTHVYGLLAEELLSASPARVTADGITYADFDKRDPWIVALGYTRDALQAGRGKRGPKGWPDTEYARLAIDYIGRCETGSRSPVADLARARGMSEVAMRAALNRARRRGLLSRKRPGSAGGVLTPTARRILRTAKGQKGRKGR